MALPSWSTFLQCINVIATTITLDGMRRVIETTDDEYEDTDVFFCIDTLYNDAFVHWHAESAVFLRYWTDLLQEYPNIRILLDKDRVFKRLALRAYNIPSDRVVFTLPTQNLCIFPPLILLNDMNIDTQLFSALWTAHIRYLWSAAKVEDSREKKISVLGLPRQTRENFNPNDRLVSGTLEMCEWVKNQRDGVVLHTDEISDLLEQVRIVRASEKLILDYGSSFFMNGSFAKDSRIFVANGTLLDYPGLHVMVQWMKDNGNEIVFVGHLSEACCEKMIHIFGDSHARFCFADMPNAVIHSFNSMTMHRVGRDGLSAVNCRAEGVSDGDLVFFIFGEVDCRCHVERQVALGREYRNVITELADNYFRTIAENRSQFRSLSIVIVSVVPPIRYTEFEAANPPLEENFPFPFVGSDARRVEITRDMNEALRTRSQLEGYRFLDIYQLYARDDGTLKFELSDTICHIKENSHVLREAKKTVDSLNVTISDSQMSSYGSRSQSQAGQDLFVLEMLKGKRNGTFLEIGANSATYNSNTIVLERDFGWKGLLVEYERAYEREYQQCRTSAYVIMDARQVPYADLLKDFPVDMDYLQVDLEVVNRSTLDVLELLEREVFPKHKFATVTFEHDIYQGDFFETRKMSREIFARNGYRSVFRDVSHCGNSFEDWYVHPDLVSYSTDGKTDLPKDYNDIIRFIQNEK